MNKIQQLIKELCPDGVEYKELGEVMDITRGASPRPINNFITNDENGVSWIKIGDVDPKSKYITQTKEKITIEGAEKSRFLKKGDFVLSNSMSYGRPYILKIDGCIHDGWISMRNFKEVLNPDFLYHLLGSDVAQNYWNQKASSGTVQNLNADIVRATIIPIPPLPIQQEIVKILDTFTALDATLQAELEARRKQYEHYRNQLLNFEGKDVEWKTLGEIGNVCMCKRVMKHETKPMDDIPFFKIGTFGKEPDAYISKALYEKYKSKFSFPKKGDILISASGTIGRRVIYDSNPAYFQDSNIVWLSNNEKIILNKLLYYIYETIDWPVEGGIIKRLYNENLKKIKIPIPPLSEQERIVSILDKFDALVNIELPAEIEARRKQYEYYREKLLTFEPLVN